MPSGRIDGARRITNPEFQALLVELGDRLRELEDTADLSFAAAEILGRALGVSRAGYGTIDPAAETITIERDWNAPGIKSLAGVLHFRDYGSYIEDLKRGDTVVFADAEKDPRTAATADALKAISAQAVVNMPVTEQGGLVALLYLNHATARDWSADELAFVREVAERTRTTVERRRAEQELRNFAAALERQVEERTRERDRLWELSEDLLVHADYDGRLLRVSPSWTRLLGYDEATLLTRPYDRFIHPDDLATVTNALLAMRSRGRPVSFEDRVLAADGTWRWVAWTLSPDPDRQRLTGVGRDITAARKAAEALQSSEARLRTIFETSYQFQGLMAPDGTLLDANATSLKGIRSTLADVIGKKFWDTPWFNATPGMPEAVRAAVTAVATGETVREEIVVNLPTGRRSFDFSMRPMRDQAGNVIAIVPEAVETTERRSAEDALRQAQKMEAIGQLTGGLAHDFNNLLTGVLGNLELLEARLTDQGLRKLVHSAARSAQRGAELTAQLLAFSRKQHLAPKPIDLNTAVGRMNDMLPRTVGGGVEVKTALAGDLWPALIDASQIEVAILNLAINARDAMPRGGTVVIGTRNVPADERDRPADLPSGDYVAVSVADTGEGMTPEVLARAFDPFFTTKEVGKGTGLGLSQVYGLARQSGGTVQIRSRRGHGTTVEIYLPRAADEFHTAAGQAEFLGEASARGRGTVLVVDDQEEVREVAVAHLEALGYRAVPITSGGLALDLLKGDGPIDVLLVDLAMPDLSGLDVIQAARKARPGLPVVLMTGYADADMLGKRAEGVVLLRKPFRMQELAAALDAAPLRSAAVEGESGKRE